MRRRGRYRGISLGTIVMLVLTVAVTGGMLRILPHMMGDTHIILERSASQQETLDLSALAPALTLIDIPIAPATPAASPHATDELVAAASASDDPQTEQSAVLQPAETPLTASAPLPTASATPVKEQRITLTLGGSINMDDAVRKAGYYSDSKKYDFVESLSLISDELQSDVTILSLENLVIPHERVSDLITPSTIMDCLYENGVDLLALGFPKAGEYGLSGLTSTIDAAEEQQLRVIGAYASEHDAAQTTMITVHGIQIAVLHYTEGLSEKSQSVLAGEDALFAIPVADEAVFRQDIAEVRKQGAQVVIVSMNWGGSGKGTPTRNQQTIAQQLADAGADVIFGAGTRVVQPVSWLFGTLADGSKHRTLCAYSLGSLLNASRKDGNVASMLLQLTLSIDPDTNNVRFERAAYTPTYIWRYTLDDQSHYRVVASDEKPPIGMSDDQAGYKDNAHNTILKKLDGETLILR